MRLYSRSLLLVALLAAASCTKLPLHHPVPESLSGDAVVEGFPAGIRSWADEPAAGLAASIEKRIATYCDLHKDYYAKNKRYPAMNYLALSGGSNDGAYAAGILSGWSKAGTRPDFAIVTGISTGALIAPFAFLGSDYDEVLKREYTTMKTDGIFLGDVWTVLDGITGGLSIVDTTPLKKRIDELITPELFAEIAAEHKKGRRLLIGTTNLEAQRGVIWNIGKIANSNLPGSLELFKQILRASTAIPGVFEPVFIDVTAGGKRYQEIHVDGGVTSQVFLYPLKSSRLDKDAFIQKGIERNLYIIRNGKLTPDYKQMEPALLSLSERSVDTLIKNQGIGDLYRLYTGANRDGMNYRLTYIPSDFTEKPLETFDPAYMSKLYELGYKRGLSGDYWAKQPPGIEYTD